VAINAHLDDFVRRGLERGLARPEIEQALLQAGWPADQVRAAIGAYAPIEFPIPVPRPVSSASARDAFLHVVMFVTLALSAYQLGALLFEIINRLVSDPAAPVQAVSAGQAMRWSISSLVVTFPVFVGTHRVIARSLRRDPTKRASRTRRNVTYVILFVASAAVLGDVTTMIYYFLGGEVTLRFLLKVATVAGIAGTVFLYYLWDLRAGEDEPET
jgi:hypothetical protein